MWLRTKPISDPFKSPSTPSLLMSEYTPLTCAVLLVKPSNCTNSLNVTYTWYTQFPIQTNGVDSSEDVVITSLRFSERNPKGFRRTVRRGLQIEVRIAEAIEGRRHRIVQCLSCECLRCRHHSEERAEV